MPTRTSVYVQILLLLLAVTLAGCTMPYAKPTFSGSDDPVIGISAEASRVPTTDVIAIHGICTHGQKWLDNTALTLAHLLNAKESDTQISTVLLRPLVTFDNQTRLYLVNLSLAGGHDVRLYEILWSPATTPIKNRLCFDISAKTADKHLCRNAGSNYTSVQRANINRQGKEKLIDDCLSDAVIYLGSYHDTLLHQIRSALITALAGASSGTSSFTPNSSGYKAEMVRLASNATNPLFIISESLGSKLIFDALSDRGNSPPASWQQLLQRTRGRTVEIFMAANQLPLLQLADSNEQSPCSGAADKHDSMVDFAAIKPSEELQSSIPYSTPKLRIITFSDPNDFLSYSLHRSIYRTCGNLDITDVRTSIAYTYVNEIENPVAAHHDFGKKRHKILKIIAYGHRE